MRLKEARKLLRRAQNGVGAETRQDIQRAANELSEALKLGKVSKINKASDRLGVLVDKHLDAYRKPAWRESMESIGLAVLVALFLRSFVVEAFKIPSGSMIPTLLVGDQIFVNKYVYGVRVPFTSIRIVDFSLPERGEVVVFRFPNPPHEDYIKRVVGLPGDKIEMKAGVLYINDQAVPREALGREAFTDAGDDGPEEFSAIRYRETLGEHSYIVLEETSGPHHGPSSNFGPLIVPDGELFMMGDNRDNSFDSRGWGTVPQENVLGRALFVWFTWGPEGFSLERLGDRFGTWIN